MMLNERLKNAEEEIRKLREHECPIPEPHECPIPEPHDCNSPYLQSQINSLLEEIRENKRIISEEMQEKLGKDEKIRNLSS